MRGYNGGLLSPGAKNRENLCGKIKRDLAKKEKVGVGRGDGRLRVN